MADKAVKANLKIQLLANDVLVAESSDDTLWRKVLAAMQGAGEVPNSDELKDEEIPRDALSGKEQKGLASFAADLGLDTDAVEDACSPSDEAPFIHLEDHCWESFKKNTPPKGPKSVASINLAVTLLCLWFKYSGREGNPTQAEAQAVLGTIGEKEKNASRAVKNCAWLQSQENGIRINSAKISKAKAIAKAYCTQTPIESGE